MSRYTVGMILAAIVMVAGTAGLPLLGLLGVAGCAGMVWVEVRKVRVLQEA